MRYEVRKWKHGWGIWRVWRFFAWRCRDVGPFGWDMPWTVESLAHDKCASLYNRENDMSDNDKAKIKEGAK